MTSGLRAPAAIGAQLAYPDRQPLAVDVELAEPQLQPVGEPAREVDGDIEVFHGRS